MEVTNRIADIKTGVQNLKDEKAQFETGLDTELVNIETLLGSFMPQ